MNIKKCPSLLTFLQNQRQNSTVSAFLRNSLCGYEGKYPKVCCELDSQPTDNSPSTTTTGRAVVSLESGNVETVKSTKLPSQSTCGKSDSTHERVVGGVPAILGSWPWMAALGYQNLKNPGSDYEWLCGGTLISDRYALTAAHCIVKHKKLAVLHLGDLDLNPDVQDLAAPINIPISHIIVHERYSAQRVINDIALLKLDRTVKFNELIQPICLPTLQNHRSNQLVNAMAFVAGWGSTSYKGPSSTKLMEVQLPVFDNSECKDLYVNKSAVIDERVLCAGLLIGGIDSCQGDSGGPLMWRSGNQYYLVGVVSYGIGCAEPGFPGVYTRVTHFIDWIVKNMNKF